MRPPRFPRESAKHCMTSPTERWQAAYWAQPSSAQLGPRPSVAAARCPGSRGRPGPGPGPPSEAQDQPNSPKQPFGTTSLATWEKPLGKGVDVRCTGISKMRVGLKETKNEAISKSPLPCVCLTKVSHPCPVWAMHCKNQALNGAFSRMKIR